MSDLFKQKRKTIFVILFIILVLFLRTTNYYERIRIGSDNTRDLSVAVFAFDHNLLPQIGQFSSAGPFFYGPWWYWFLEIISVFPFGNLTHWYMMTLISLLFIGGVYLLGVQIGNKWIGSIAAFFAGISYAQIANSLSVWNPAIIPTLSLLGSIFLLKCYTSQKWKYFALTGFIIGLAITIHFQSFLMVPVVLMAFLLTKWRFRNMVSLCTGFLVPFIPPIIFDMRFNWYNFKSIWFYLTVGQYNIWVPNRWLTYAGRYWPETWSLIIGGLPIVGGLLILLLALFTLMRLPQWKKYIPFYILAITFVFEIILYRYYRGERFFYYSFFAQPTVLVLSAWVIYEVFQRNKMFAIVFLAIITMFSVNKATDALEREGVTYPMIQQIKQEIYQKYPEKSFDIFGCPASAGDFPSYPLAYFMYREEKNSIEGQKISVCFNGGKISWTELSDEQIEIDRNKDYRSWYNRSVEQVYKETAEWWKDNPPN